MRIVVLYYVATCFSVTMYLLWLTLAKGILACSGVKEGTVNNRTWWWWTW